MSRAGGIRSRLRAARSLRTRVTLAATAAVAVVLTVAGILIITAFADQERSSVDQDLRRRAQGPLRQVGEIQPPRRGRFGRGGVPGGPGAGPPPGQGEGGPGAAPPPGEPPPELSQGVGSFARVIDGGAIVAAVGDVPSDGFPLPKRLGFTTVEAGGREWRTLTIKPRLRPQRRIQLAVDLKRQQDRVDDLALRVAVVSAIGLVLAALLVALFTGPALRPLGRLREAVAGVSTTSDLSTRLPERDGPDEVQALAASVNAMLARLEASTGETEQALEATRRFAADVGHELRTPLTSIRANFDALARNPSLPEEERRAIVAELATEQQRLVALLDSLQALARGDAGKALPRQEIEVDDVVDAAVEAAKARNPSVEFALEGSARGTVEGWPDGVRLVADNLIENAARHGGGRVEVGLRSGADGAVVLTVDDDGPGVPVAERERVFERFHRGAGTAAPGSGLGLALVAQQAALHGGAVSISGSDLGGARFEVSLPR